MGMMPSDFRADIDHHELFFDFKYGAPHDGVLAMGVEFLIDQGHEVLTFFG
jgi:hypothetical protein